MNYNQLTTKDLEAIAHFNKIVKNYLKLQRITREGRLYESNNETNRIFQGGCQKS